MDAELTPGRPDQASVLDQRQGVFGGTFHGMVIGANYGTINVYAMETGPSGTVLHDGTAPPVTTLESLADTLSQGAVFISGEGDGPDTLAEVRLGGLLREQDNLLPAIDTLRLNRRAAPFCSLTSTVSSHRSSWACRTSWRPPPRPRNSGARNSASISLPDIHDHNARQRAKLSSTTYA